MIYFVQFIRKNIATSMLVETQAETPHPRILEHAAICIANDTPRVGLSILKVQGNVSVNNKVHPEREVLMWLLSGMKPLFGSQCAYPKEGT